MRVGLELARGSVARPNPLVVVWRWRYELTLVILLVAAVLALWSAIGVWELATVGAAGGLIAVCPAARRYLAVRAWCVITPHRLRTGCAQAWIHSRRGKIPVVLFTSAESFGERVYLWLRAGVSLEDLIVARPMLTTACWATDVYVARHERFAHLVMLDVIRRPSGRPAEDDWLDTTEPSPRPPDNSEPPSWPQLGTAYRR
jgi:hypothetical protein